MKVILTILLFTSIASAAPITITDYLAQEKPQGSILSSIDVSGCSCDHKSVWWPWLLPAAGIPFLFIHRDKTEIVSIKPPVFEPIKPPKPVPESGTLVLGLLGIGGLLVRRRK